VIDELRVAVRPTVQEALGWIGLRVDDVFGVTIGTIADVVPAPDAPDEPRWLLLRGGRFGGHYTLVPFEDASVGPDNVWVPYERATVRDAPTVTPTDGLSHELDDQLDAHYRDARGVPAPPILSPRPHPGSQHAHRLGRPRREAPAAPQAAPGARELQVEEARVRLHGRGEVDGEIVEIELDGTFTGTIRRR
jgi:hypothetical protein